MQTLIRSDEIYINDMVDIRIVSRKPISQTKVMPVVKELINRSKKAILSNKEALVEKQKAEYIKYLVCEFYDNKTSVRQLSYRYKDHAVGIVKAKHHAIVLIYDLTKLSEPLIGQVFNRDHSTINYTKKKISNDMIYPANKLEFENIKNFVVKKLTKIEGRHIFQFYNKGALKKEWDSVYEASSRGYNFYRILDCCIGGNRTYKGYVWTFKP
jgi:hypothetical protein